MSTERVVLTDDTGKPLWQISVDKKKRLIRQDGLTSVVFSQVGPDDKLAEVAALSSAQGFHHDIALRLGDGGDKSPSATMSVDTGGIDKSVPQPSLTLLQEKSRIYLGMSVFAPALKMSTAESAVLLGWSGNSQSELRQATLELKGREKEDIRLQIDEPSPYIAIVGSDGKKLFESPKPK